MTDNEPIEGLDFLDSCFVGILRLFFGTPIQAVLSLAGFVAVAILSPLGLIWCALFFGGDDATKIFDVCIYAAPALFGLSLFIGICRALSR